MNDCDGVTDEDDAVDPPTWYSDHDSDGYGYGYGYGYGSDDYIWVSCDAPDGYIADDTDCDDALSTTFPGADETCDGTDNDCDGAIDEDAIDMVVFFADTDEDGFGDAESAVWACSTPEGHVEDDSDCDDEDDSAYPGAPGWTIDCEAIVNVPGDTGDIGDTGDDDDTGAPLDTGDGPVGTEDTGPLDTGDDPEDDPGDVPGEGLGDSPDDDPSVINDSNKGCSCANGQRNPMAPWLLVFVLVGAARLRTRP